MLNSFRVSFSILTALIGGALLCLQLFAPHLFHPHAWYVLGYCAGIVLVGHLIMKKGLNTPAFHNYAMGATTIRLVITALGLGIYFYTFSENRILFAVTFFIIYFLYLGFDIKTLLSNLRQNS